MTETSGELEPPVTAKPVPGEVQGPHDWFLRAIGFGLVCGCLELGMTLVRRSLDPRISMDSLRTNRHFIWMIPVSDVSLFCAVGLLIAFLARYRPAPCRRVAWRLLVGLTVLSPLLTVEGLYTIGSATLAGGFGVLFGPWIGRLAARHRRLAARHRRFARAWLSALAGGLLILTCLDYARVTSQERRALSGRPPAPAGAPNLLLIVLDNVRAESMSLYGHDRLTTPHIDRLARKGVRFTRARSTAPWTLPSHASMFTGRWCHDLSVRWDEALDSTHPTLAEYLAGHGYATAGFVGNTYYCNARYGLGRGFARYEDCYENQVVSPFEVVRSSGLGRRILQALGVPVRVEQGGTSLRKTAEMLNRDALGWLAERPRERPFFVFLNYYDAHGPFIPPEGPDPRFGLSARPKSERLEILERYQRLLTRKQPGGDRPREQIVREASAVLRDSYESCIAYLDRQVGRLYDALDRRGLLENTLVIVTSDHGEHFHERGFLGHGLSLYGREVHVPLLIFPPSTGAAGRVVTDPVSLRELPATSVELLGLRDRSPFPGLSLDRFWKPGATKARSAPSPVLSEVDHQRHLPAMHDVPATRGAVKSVVSGGRVYIRTGDGGEELFDLLSDPAEAHNLIDVADLRPAVRHFRGLLDRLLPDTGKSPTVSGPAAGGGTMMRSATDD